VEVILLKDVEQVGLRGDVVNVARGYMRNFLEPRGLAQPATPALLAELGKREAQRARHEARDGEQAQQIADRLGSVELRFDVKAGPRGRLFGSVTPTNIVDELWAREKIRVDRRKLDLPDNIKRVGRYAVPVTVFEDVKAEIKVAVAPEGGELPSEDEVAAWEAEERAEELAAAGEPEPSEDAEALEAALAEADAEEAGDEEAAEALPEAEGDAEAQAEGDAEAESQGEGDAQPGEAGREGEVEAAWAAHEETVEAELEDDEPSGEASETT
jgi:large subunit ribosomal protein L9